MLKLNAGISRKMGEPNYGSRGAAANFELEVESTLVNDSLALLERIRGLFALARQAVDEELNNVRHESGSPNGKPTQNGHVSGQPLDRLSIREAGQLIDDLKARQDSGASR